MKLALCSFGQFFVIQIRCCPVKIVKYHLRLNSLNSVLDIQALI